MLTAQRPDIGMWAVNLWKVFVFELTLLLEENIYWVYQCKLVKYDDLR